MPLAPMIPVLQTSLTLAMSSGPAATPETSAVNIVNAVASFASAGILISGPSPVIPIGIPLATTMMITSFRSAPADVSIAAGDLADAISQIAPMVPPAGLALLKTSLTLAFSKAGSATAQNVASDITNAISTYYTTGGVV